MPKSPTAPIRAFSARTVAEIGLMLALFAVLDYLAVRLPINVAGGSISFAMVPIILYAVVRGPALGTLTGALAGGLDMLVQPYFVHPVQVALDYPVAYAVVGLGAGLLAASVDHSFANGKSGVGAALTVAAGVLAGALRLAAHFTSGLAFFASSAPEGQAVWVYSLVYNLTYVAPSVLISTLVVLAAVRPVLRAVSAQASAQRAD